MVTVRKVLVLLLFSTTATVSSAVDADPTCSTGVSHVRKKDGIQICCAASCGSCGDTGCSSRPGGADSCCTGPVLDSGRSCHEFPPPCFLNPSSFLSQPVDPFCASGVQGDSNNSSQITCCARDLVGCGYDDTNCSASALRTEHDDCTINQTMSSCETSKPPCAMDGISFEQWPIGSHPYRDFVTVTDAEICNMASSQNNTCIEVLYEPYEQGSKRVSGMSSVPPSLEYTLSYDVYFEEGFQFTRGGKLHGLGPMNKISGCNPMTPTGWSARVMWKRDGILSLYLYHQDKEDFCGHHFLSAAPIQRGQWESVSLYVKVNSASDAFDGMAKLYLNGELIVQALNLRFVTDPAWAVPHEEGLIANFLFSTFHGGSDPSWAPNATQRAYFDNFAVLPGEQIRGYTTTALESSTSKRRYPMPRTFHAEEMSCRDKNAIPFDDYKK